MLARPLNQVPGPRCLSLCSLVDCSLVACSFVLACSSPVLGAYVAVPST